MAFGGAVAGYIVDASLMRTEEVAPCAVLAAALLGCHHTVLEVPGAPMSFVERAGDASAFGADNCSTVRCEDARRGLLAGCPHVVA